jgi:FO synthase
MSSELLDLSTDELMRRAAALRDRRFGNVVTYSRKVFIPLTQLCRDVCRYCTFAKTPSRVVHPYLDIEQVLEIARAGLAAGCKEALFTLGEKPEVRYAVAAEWLRARNYASTIEYLVDAAGRVLGETGLLPHINAGTLTSSEIDLLRTVSGSMGIMLESSSARLAERGMPHYGSPDKQPAARLATLLRLGEKQVPTTSGILIGIGETAEERIDSLVALRDLHAQYGHLQEVIIQNFRSKAGTAMAGHPEPSTDELVRTIAFARLILTQDVSVQAPPNLNPGVLGRLIEAGINDWGGVSPVTADHVNPEAPWPHLDALARQTMMAGKTLVERLTLYPSYVHCRETWVDADVRPNVLRASDASGLARDCEWTAGARTAPPAWIIGRLSQASHQEILSPDVAAAIDMVRDGYALSEDQIVRLFEARGDDVFHICAAANDLRRQAVGESVTYVVTRNINYTNVCTYGCRFCAFSKGKTHDSLRGPAYDISLDEIARRTREAWLRGATEVCMQGGINPRYTGATYLEILRAAKDACPDVHVHAFSPLEVTQGARTLGMTIADYLCELRDAGLGSLPGTAAEVLDDEVRAVLCPDKLSTDEWLAVIETAHRVGLRSTATIMFGHVDMPRHWARHLLHIRALQARTGGFTEFVPLPFVAAEAPIYLRGGARNGPTFRECLLMHAVARIVLHPVIRNVQVSWVKMGGTGVEACLGAGVNDLGGTLMNESITRAAGAMHGQEAPPATLEEWIRRSGRIAVQRTTLYGFASEERCSAAASAPPLLPVVNQPYRSRKVTGSTSRSLP